MINAIVNGIFKLVTMLANVIITPLISGVVVLFPAVGPILNHIMIFLSQMVMYIPLLIDLSLIPRAAIVMLFDYYLIKYSIHLLQQAVSFSVRIYNYFKM